MAEAMDDKPRSLAWGRIRTFLRPQVTITPIPAGMAADWDVPVTVRDGTTLRVNVFRPAAAGIHPVILSAHPYGKDRIPARTRSGRGVNFQYRLFPQPDPISLSEWTGWEAPDPAQWVPRGYVVINADQRGGGTSEGRAELFSDQEAEDYYDLIEWAGTQAWSNGRVGLDGVSYLAISQYKVAALHPPHLAAICPWEGFSDLYRDFARPGGAREDGFSIVWSGRAARHGWSATSDARSWPGPSATNGMRPVPRRSSESWFPPWSAAASPTTRFTRAGRSRSSAAPDRRRNGSTPTAAANGAPTMARRRPECGSGSSTTS